MSPGETLCGGDYCGACCSFYALHSISQVIDAVTFASPVGTLIFPFSTITHCPARGAIRRKYDIAGGAGEDCLVVWCCLCCALVQVRFPEYFNHFVIQYISRRLGASTHRGENQSFPLLLQEHNQLFNSGAGSMPSAEHSPYQPPAGLLAQPPAENSMQAIPVALPVAPAAHYPIAAEAMGRPPPFAPQAAIPPAPYRPPPPPAAGVYPADEGFGYAPPVAAAYAPPPPPAQFPPPPAQNPPYWSK